MHLDAHCQQQQQHYVHCPVVLTNQNIEEQVLNAFQSSSLLCVYFQSCDGRMYSTTWRKKPAAINSRCGFLSVDTSIYCKSEFELQFHDKTYSVKGLHSWGIRMEDSEIIDRLLEQTTHLVRQAWTPVVVGSILNMYISDWFWWCSSLFWLEFLSLVCQAEGTPSYSRPQATRFGGSRPFRWEEANPLCLVMMIFWG